MNPSDPLRLALADLEALRASGLAAFDGATSPQAVEASRVEYLGQKQGRLKAAQERIKSLEPATKRVYGQEFNATKAALESSYEAAKARVARSALVQEGLDVSLPGIRPRLGHRHPLTQTA